MSNGIVTGRPPNWRQVMQDIAKTKRPLKAWKVTSPSEGIPTFMGDVRSDTVFYRPDMTEEDVRRSLIEHDGYPSDIELQEGS